MKQRFSLILNLIGAALLSCLIIITETRFNIAWFNVICNIGLAIISLLVYKDIKELVSNNKHRSRIMLFLGVIFILVDYMIVS